MPDIFISDELEKTKEKKDERPKQENNRVDLKPPSGPARHKLPGHTHNPLSAFLYYPDHTNFVTQDPEEKIVLLLRRHPITNLRWILIAVLLIIAPFLLSSLPIVDFLPTRFQIVAVISWFLLTIAFVYEEFLSWFFNVYIVTDERIVDVDFVNLVYREITDANIDQIQDVTAQMGGVIRTIFNYGDVAIQTAAEIPQIDFEAVPNPDRVSRVLRELRVEEEQEKLEGRVR